MKKNKFRLIIGILCLCVIVFCGCANEPLDNSSNGNIYFYPQENPQDDMSDEAGNAEEDNLEGLFLVISVNSMTESIRLYRYTNGLEYQYYYTLNTQFLDKYGNHTSITNFSSGKVVEIDRVDDQGRIGQIKITDRVWEYKNITRYSVDEQKAIFSIADSKYRYDDKTQIVSDGNRKKMSDLSENDKLCIIGIGKKIISIVITTGHGNLRLTNTGLFEGSYLQLNSNIFVQITPDMELEVCEGDYVLSVANDGWGGSCDITISRDETTIVDLDSIKGDGPKYGTILFTVNVEGAVIQIDGTAIDYSNTVELKYGWHTMKVTADGYEEWAKRLYVNSEEATIVIELEEADKTDDKDNEQNNDSDKDDEKENDSDKNDNSSLTSKDRDKLLSDYLSTLTELLGSM